MNLKALFVLFVFCLWSLWGLWWYHQKVICACDQNGLSSVHRETLVSPGAANNSASADARTDTVHQAGTNTLGKDQTNLKSAQARVLPLKSDSITSVKLHEALIVYFPINSTQANTDQQTKKNLKELIESSKQSRSMNFEVVGHSDAQGTAKMNRALGLKRAERIKQLLISLGADSTRIISRTRGSEQPLADNSTPQGRTKNRRAEIRLHTF